MKIKIKTVQKVKSRIWEMKGGTYAKTLAKIQVRGLFRIRDIRRAVHKLLQFSQKVAPIFSKSCSKVAPKL